MIGLFLIALAAGAASALMFASPMSGAAMSILLALFAPVPLIVVGISWGRLCAAIGGVAAMAAVLAIFGADRGVAFAVTIALPAWWLGHLVLLGRPMTEPQDGVEWYPPGSI
ncbi:MAG: hypothetical protein E6699_39860, partial [Bradyrhizobium sp.]|nr:hypothetical protein [Bradyrhizobium sp.]